MRSFIVSLSILTLGSGLLAQERFAETPQELISREEVAYHRVAFPIPDPIVLEVGGILPVGDHRVLLTTRRGEIWWVDGAYDADPHPRYSLFASGLHEILGIAAAPSGGYYVAQREEVTHITDEDGDGVADHFETVYKIPLSGNYHEYSYGPVVGHDGNLYLTVNVAFGGPENVSSPVMEWFGAPTQSQVPWRGWALKITPGGQMTPIAAGLRSPAGSTMLPDGTWIYSDNQGEWVGACRVTVIEPGDFMGHPASLAWSDLPGSPVSLHISDIPNTGEPFHEVAKRVPGIKMPAVWFPYAIMGISASGIQQDLTQGKFGPFAGQFFIGDQGQSKIMRMSLEKVKGAYQGACYSFHAGFDSGILRLAMGENNSLLVGSTNRGWGSVGKKDYAFERLEWTGKVPFEIKEVTAEPDGFLVKFTQPVDPVSGADPATYQIKGFTYKYHETYGSPIINLRRCPVVKVVLAPDHLSARLAVACLRPYYIHEIQIANIKSETARESLVHDTAYYTLNQIPDGDRLIPVIPGGELCDENTIAPDASGVSVKHPNTIPADWDAKKEVDLALKTVSGLKFDQTILTVKVGALIKLTLVNNDDMLHNFVLTNPGQGQIVGALALNLGLEGPAKNYVPDSPDVIVHTNLLNPKQADTLYFKAPLKTGDYDYICSFPGHYALMHGVLKVVE